MEYLSDLSNQLRVLNTNIDAFQEKQLFSATDQDSLCISLVEAFQLTTSTISALYRARFKISQALDEVDAYMDAVNDLDSKRDRGSVHVIPPEADLESPKTERCGYFSRVLGYQKLMSQREHLLEHESVVHEGEGICEPRDSATVTKNIVAYKSTEEEVLDNANTITTPVRRLYCDDKENTTPLLYSQDAEIANSKFLMSDWDVLDNAVVNNVCEALGISTSSNTTLQQRRLEIKRVRNYLLERLCDAA